VHEELNTTEPRKAVGAWRAPSGGKRKRQHRQMRKDDPRPEPSTNILACYA